MEKEGKGRAFSFRLKITRGEEDCTVSTRWKKEWDEEGRGRREN